MENVKKRNTGRKKNEQVTNNEMLVWIERYIKEFPNEKIDISKLAGFSEIKRHYWYYREGMKARIDEINNIKYNDYEVKISGRNSKLLELPDIDSLIENNYRSKQRLKEVISSYFDTLQEFYDSACKVFELQKDCRKMQNENNKLKGEIERLKSKNYNYVKLVESYENQLRTLKVRSSETVYRKENGIKCNLLNINDHKKIEFTTDSAKLKDMLDSL